MTLPTLSLFDVRLLRAASPRRCAGGRGVARRYTHRAATLVLVAALAPAGGALAAEPSVRIASPADGAKLDAMEQNRLVYEVDPGPRGDHVHVYVDGKEVGILRQLKGTYAFETLAPGSRELCVKIVNKAHTPTGVQHCVRVHVD